MANVKVFADKQTNKLTDRLMEKYMGQKLYSANLLMRGALKFSNTFTTSQQKPRLI